MLVRLKNDLDDYHRQRASKHGWLYIVTRKPGWGLYESRSIATGVLCTLLPEFVEEVDDAEELQEGSRVRGSA
jgi:hypothetical protein